MNTPVPVDTRLMQQLVTDGLLPVDVNIQANTLTLDEFGGSADSWANVSGLTGLDGALARARRPASSKDRTPEYVETISTHEITIAGAYPTITTAMRAVIGAQAYEILVVHVDSQALSTLLYVRQVTT